MSDATKTVEKTGSFFKESMLMQAGVIFFILTILKDADQADKLMIIALACIGWALLSK